MNVSILKDASDHTFGLILVAGTFPTVTVQGLAIAIFNTTTATFGAGTDKCGCPDDHTINTGASQGSLNVTAGGNSVHRIGDKRGCGALTVLGTEIRTVNVN